MKQKTGIAIDARGQKIGTARHCTDEIKVHLHCLKSEVVQPVRIVWDDMNLGLADYQAGAVIAVPKGNRVY